ncbi:hypothetical protein DXG01_012913 [Tephrocybe rancida]|nr:hypothetical protein DXG01_012913 [Tephrocybe rancida]
MMDSRTTSILAITGITALGGALAYAVYFDHKRRTDADFRRKLRKEKKRVDKTVAQQSKESLALEDKHDAAPASMKEALDWIRKEEPPTSPDEREAYFMQQVGAGEQLAARGPQFYLEAAMAFYRALRVYPAPMELIVIYEKTVPQPVFKAVSLNSTPKMVMDMTALDVSNDSPASNNGVSLSEEDGEMSPTSGGPPSVASSQEWDKVTDPGTQTPAS